MIVIPEGFVRETVGREGEPGQRWIASLPALVDELLQRWSCVPDGPVMHGRVGLVVPVRRPDLPPAVLKVSFPHPGNVFEPHAFAAWSGRGAVRLFERDDERFAMLLERARGTLAEIADFDTAVSALGQVSRRLAVDAPAGLPLVADLTAEWTGELTELAAAFGNPLPPRVLDAALDTLRDLGPDQPGTLVHGDLHDGNVLLGDREPFLAIDPKGYVGDPAYDTFTVIRSLRFAHLLFAPDAVPQLLRGLDILCEAAELDRERARRWAQVRAVKSTLWGRRHGDEPWLIEVTDRLAEALG
ncbi:phosphotransferase [Nocardia cyriacigeorgica]|uniref:aminoglycoside phosphotransferase family protein n=1 Tax=Nocardia cyriacigeorgica TaxID=135487 RepID=UPI0018947991|nr:aminoglycoside phosphotransferase family protein [Nocardia cyriacigeorgica]MBF6320632.1 phosphotransferase [Nocardia cyriacigeorgica]MBF6535075.1 phosphotransferase [Nocardia cyriacigeorgica]